MDLLRDIGALGLGSRLKRLSDQLMQDGIRIYRQSGLDFEPKWFPVYYFLSEVGPSSVTEVARGLGITHPSVNQVAREMIKADLVAAYKDPKDKRKRVLALTSMGKQKRPELEIIWRDVSGALQELLNETEVDFLGYIETLERALDKSSFLDRFQQRAAPSENTDFDIIFYSPELAADFKSINLAWILEDFELEEADKQTLDHPDTYVIEPGGEILFARDHKTEEIYGTCALINRGEGKVELAKMGVSRSARGKGVGKALAHMAVAHARKMGFSLLFLKTSSRLAPAIGLYRKMGFKRKTHPEQSDYAQCDIYMDMGLLS